MVTLICPPNKRRVSLGSSLELLSNSIKFSPSRCSIIVQLTPLQCTNLSLWPLSTIHRILSCCQITEKRNEELCYRVTGYVMWVEGAFLKRTAEDNLSREYSMQYVALLYTRTKAVSTPHNTMPSADKSTNYSSYSNLHWTPELCITVSSWLFYLHT